MTREADKYTRYYKGPQINLTRLSILAHMRYLEGLKLRNDRIT